MDYDFDILYKNGKINSNADALSRVEINIKELKNPDEDTESMILNIDDLPVLTDLELTEILQNNPDQDFPVQIDEIIDVQPSTSHVNDLDKRMNIRDSVTQHSNLENPILEIPYTEYPLNHFSNQVILKTKNVLLKDHTVEYSYDKKKCLILDSEKGKKKSNENW